MDKILIFYAIIVIVGNSVPTGEEDISPYATFHLLGMREEAAKNGQLNNPANFQTMPHPPQQGVGTMHSGANMVVQGQAPQTPRHVSQTMNVSYKKSPKNLSNFLK